MAKLYMGFDAGTQSVKVGVYDENFELVASRSLPTELSYPHPGWVEMNVDTYLENCITAMAEVTSELRRIGRDPKDIAAIMGDGIICGIVGIDENARPVTPYINYLDSRTTEDVEALNAKKLSIWGRETGNAEASPMFPAMFARWFLRNSPEFCERGVKFVHNAPYVLMRLRRSGEEVVAQTARAPRDRRKVHAPHPEALGQGGRSLRGNFGTHRTSRRHSDSRGRGRHDAVDARLGRL